MEFCNRFKVIYRYVHKQVLTKGEKKEQSPKDPGACSQKDSARVAERGEQAMP